MKRFERRHWSIAGFAVGMMLLLFARQASAQIDRSNNPVQSLGSTANFRFAEPSEFPITVTLLGAVQRPGRYEISRKIDLINLLALAGGWIETADMAKVRISRTSPTGISTGRVVIDLDLEDPTEVSQQFLQLQDGDNIFVGHSNGMTLPTVLSVVSTASAIVMAIAYIAFTGK
jgi:hypothetical protein